MARGSWLVIGACLGLCVFATQPATALSVTYALAPSSTATLFVHNGTVNLLQGQSFTTGLSGSITLDLVTFDVSSFAISITPNTSLPFCGSCNYGGVTNATIVAATLASSTPFTGSGAAIIPGLFTFTGSSAEVDATYSVGGGAPVDISFGGTSIHFQINSLGLSSAYEAIVTGQNLGTISGLGFGEPEDLTISSNLTMVLVPEPGSGTLALLGLAGLAWRRRARTS